MIVKRTVRSRFSSLTKQSELIFLILSVFPIWIAQDFTDEVHMGFNLCFGGDPLF